MLIGLILSKKNLSWKNKANISEKQKEKGKNDRKFGVYSCLFVVNMKKQSQFQMTEKWRIILYGKWLW